MIGKLPAFLLAVLPATASFMRGAALKNIQRKMESRTKGAS
jgi:hypothetical protein